MSYFVNPTFPPWSCHSALLSLGIIMNSFRGFFFLLNSPWEQLTYYLFCLPQCLSLLFPKLNILTYCQTLPPRNVWFLLPKIFCCDDSVTFRKSGCCHVRWPPSYTSRAGLLHPSTNLCWVFDHGLLFILFWNWEGTVFCPRVTSPV